MSEVRYIELDKAIEIIQREIDIYEREIVYSSPDDHQNGWFRGMYNAQTLLRLVPNFQISELQEGN